MEAVGVMKIVNIKRVTVLFFLSLLTTTANTAVSSAVSVLGSVQEHEHSQLQKHLFQMLPDADVEYSVVAAPVTKNIVNKLMYNTSVDIVGLPPAALSRVNGAGWIVDLSSDNRFIIAASESYKNIASTLRHNGKLVALGQVASTHAIPLIDLSRYEGFGLSREDFPRDWDELYEQLFALAEAGGKQLYLPYWYSSRTGLSVGFTAEILNRGGSMLDPTNNSTAMPVNYGAAFDTLVAWRQLLERGIVDPDILSLDESEYVELYLNTDYVFAAHKSNLFVMLMDNDKKKSKTITIPPRRGHSWGIASANLFSIVDKSFDNIFQKSARRDFLIKSTYDPKINGLKNAREWIEATGNFSVYQRQMESPEMIESIRSMLYYPEDAEVLLDIYKHAPTSKGLWKTVWQDEFNDYLNSQLLMYLRTPEMKPGKIIFNLNEKIAVLQSLYEY